MRQPMAQSDAAAHMDWYRIETERAYLRPAVPYSHKAVLGTVWFSLFG